MTVEKKRDPAMLDPDVRFLLANERTLLAWVRTALTLQAGGFALSHVSHSSKAGQLAGVLAILFGGVLAIIGYRRFRAADKAIRNQTLPEVGKGPAIEVFAIVLIAVVLAAIQLAGML